MSDLAPLIADLALMLICAGVMTLLFKKLGQPLVLGYIVAGFLASPHFGLLPSVVDTANIHLWSDIGVIFLLFALGLEFSIKKIFKVGGPAMVTALVIIFGMTFVGFIVGTAFGWSRMDAIFLGGMIAMSSTTIIYKAFDDLGLLKKQFAGLVMSILILEDILAVVLMVLLSTIAVSNSVDGVEMVESIAKLGFFLILWFLVGLFLIPLILRKARKLMSGETLLVVSLGLCFGMVVFAAAMGFSAAFGAFIMGSILAETVEAEQIDKLVKPVKDLFGAIFFVSVGMMVDPAMIVQYAVPILVITLAVVVGQSTFATIGVLISGKPLKTAVSCGFSLTQIGEFAFIIAGLGLSLGVTGDFLYPIVVAVSVITIFITPYMIRLSEPAYRFLDRHLPAWLKGMLDRYASGGDDTPSDKSDTRKYISDFVKVILIHSIICIALLMISFNWLVPLVTGWIPGITGHIVAALLIVAVMSPFLYSILIRRTFSTEFSSIWAYSRVMRPALVGMVLVRIFVAMGFLLFVLFKLFQLSGIPVFLIAFGAVVLLVSSRSVRKQSIRIENTFRNNMKARDLSDELKGTAHTDNVNTLISHELHFADFTIPTDPEWDGKMLSELNLGNRFGVHVVAITRGHERVDFPRASDKIFAGDVVQIVATDSGIEEFGEALKTSSQK
ncbi:MAG: cation:proton antiporter [Bacteroidales bacterium]|nr:cation:proton antiporter [Bacteroidales bacterium]